MALPVNPALALPSSESDQAQFFAELEGRYQQAAAACGELIRDFRVAGTAVRVRFAGDALLSSIAPGLAHPVTQLPEGPCCEVLVWDSESTGIAPVAPPRPREDFTTRGNLWGFDSPRYRSAYQWGEGSVNLMDIETSRAIYWVPSNRALPAWVLSCPLRSILHWWLEQNGRQLVHGAVVGDEGRGVLLPGRGGAGKSSTALACLAHGLQFIGDDYLALALDPEPRAYALYATAKLGVSDLERYPEFAECRKVEAPGYEKAVVFLDDKFPERLPESLPLSLILTPRITGRPATALGHVATSTIEWALSSGTLVHLPHVSEATVGFLSRVARSVPHAMLELGTDRSGIVDAIRGALRQSAGEMDAAPDVRPFVTVVVHLREEDLATWPTVLGSIEAQGYSRAEVLLTADPAARLADAAGLGGVHVQVHSFEHRMPTGAAWSRAIRESFSEWLLFLEPGDRLVDGALDGLMQVASANGDASWIEAPTECGQGNRWLIRKDAFRQSGLFDPNPALEGNQLAAWLERAVGNGLRGISTQTSIVKAAPPKAAPAMFSRLDLRALKEGLDRRRQQVLK